MILLLKDWLLSETAPRDDLISMNREGIFSLFGYLTLYYFASAIATFLSHTGFALNQINQMYNSNEIKFNVSNF